MKKILLSSLLSGVLFLNTAHSQTEQGGYLLGGSLAGLGVGITNNYFNIGVSPNAGYFVADGIALGASVPLSFSTSSGTNSSNSYITYGLGVFGRYYFSVSDPISFFGGASFNVSGYSYRSSYTFLGNKVVNTDNGSNSGLNVNFGGVYFLNKSIGVEGVINVGDFINSTSLSAGLGFQIYFNRNNNE